MAIAHQSQEEMTQGLCIEIRERKDRFLSLPQFKKLQDKGQIEICHRRDEHAQANRD